MKTGFTLVELLAVIVILAVLALIATPVVLSIIDDAKESAMLRSAEMYLSGVENAVMRENMNSGGNFRPNECIISNGNMICGSTNVEVEVDGEIPSTGSIVFENGKIKEVTLNYESGTIVKDTSGSLVYELQLAPGLYDETGTMTYSWQQLIDLDYIRIENNILYTDNVVSGWGAEYSEYYGHFINMFSEISKGKFVIDNSIQVLSYSAFSGTSFSKIVLPNNLKVIEDFVFEDTYIESITIPNTVEKIGQAFFGPNYVTTINFLGTKEEWNGIEFTAENLGNENNDIIVHCIDGDIVIPKY